MISSLPTFTNYGRYSSGNYGAHTMLFTDSAGRDFYFSYQTLVAFRIRGRLVVRRNIWGPTTGKHLNWIDEGSLVTQAKRVSESEFEALFKTLAKD